MWHSFDNLDCWEKIRLQQKKRKVKKHSFKNSFNQKRDPKTCTVPAHVFLLLIKKKACQSSKRTKKRAGNYWECRAYLFWKLQSPLHGKRCVSNTILNHALSPCLYKLTVFFLGFLCSSSLSLSLPYIKNGPLLVYHV